MEHILALEPAHDMAQRTLEKIAKNQHHLKNQHHIVLPGGPIEYDCSHENRPNEPFRCTVGMIRIMIIFLTRGFRIVCTKNNTKKKKSKPCLDVLYYVDDDWISVVLENRGKNRTMRYIYIYMYIMYCICM